MAAEAIEIRLARLEGSYEQVDKRQRLEVRNETAVFLAAEPDDDCYPRSDRAAVPS